MNKSASNLSFVLLCLVTATMILRPAELVKSLANLPIYEALIAATILTAHMSLLQHFKPSSLMKQPITLCLVGVAIAIPLSHLTHGYFGGAVDGLTEFIKAAMLFPLLVAILDRWSRFECYVKVVAILSTVMVLFCTVDYLGIWDLEFIKHASESYGTNAAGDDIRIKRMTGPGIFSDPNDISLLIVAAGIICFSFLFDRQQGPLRVLWLGPLVVLVTGLGCTKSRGGILAAGAAFGILMLFRYGKKTAITLGILAVIVLPLVAGRQANIDISDGTGHDRLLLWREGLVALRSVDLFFGVGRGMYEDLAGLVAHNSYVHAFVELGLFGGTMFFGMFFFSALGLFRLNRPDYEISHEGQARFLPYMAAIGASFAVGLLTLSRCYTVSTLLILGLGAAYLNLAGWHLRPRRLVLAWDKRHALQLGTASLALFIALNLFVRFAA
jgi:hypothetical protein